MANNNEIIIPDEQDPDEQDPNEQNSSEQDPEEIRIPDQTVNECLSSDQTEEDDAEDDLEKTIELSLKQYNDTINKVIEKSFFEYNQKTEREKKLNNILQIVNKVKYYEKGNVILDLIINVINNYINCEFEKYNIEVDDYKQILQEINKYKIISDDLIYFKQIFDINL